MKLSYEEGKNNGKGNDEDRWLIGNARSDLDYLTGVFPSIIPFRFTDSPEQVVLREMKGYDDDFVKYIANEANFTGKRGFDWSFFYSIGTNDYDPTAEPDTFSYVPEPLDWTAIHGYGGIQQTTKNDDSIPLIADPSWKILNVDELDERIVGLRPWYDEIWDAGLDRDEARGLGEWRGINQVIGRWMHDIDDEFVHADNSVTFYDNEFPFVVANPQKSFEGDIWHKFWEDVVKEQAQDDKGWLENTVRDDIREAEIELAKELSNSPLKQSYKESLPRDVQTRFIPEEMKASDII